MNAAEIRARFAELDDATLTKDLEREFDELSASVEQIDAYGDDVYDAAIGVFGADYATECLADGAYQGCFSSTSEFIEDHILDSLGLDGVNKNWLDYDAIWSDLRHDYTDVDGDTGVLIFEAR